MYMEPIVDHVNTAAGVLEASRRAAAFRRGIWIQPKPETPPVVNVVENTGIGEEVECVEAPARTVGPRDYLFVGSPGFVESVGAVTIKDVFRFVSSELETSYDELVGPRRERKLIFKRKILVWLAAEFLPRLSFVSIARKVYRDHTTILHHYYSVKEAVKEGSDIGKRIAFLTQKFEAEMHLNARHVSRASRPEATQKFLERQIKPVCNFDFGG